MNTCYKCQFEIKIDSNTKIHRSDECPNCYSDLRCCKMCSFFDQNSYNECRESSADRITEKEKKNFCDYFEFGNTNTLKEKVANAKSLAESLFKK